ncbi:MAG: hypothetical protein U0556_03140 [Dehalococcoidia bacterium]
MQGDYGAANPGVPPAPPRSNRNRNLLIGGGCAVLLLCVVCVGGFFAIGGLTAVGLGAAFGPVDTVSNDFLSAMRDGNWQKAYGMMDPALQREVGNVNQFQQLVTRGQAEPATWSFSSRNINNGVATWSGTGTFKSGKSGTVELELRQSGSDWKVISFDLQPK